MCIFLVSTINGGSASSSIAIFEEQRNVAEGGNHNAVFHFINLFNFWLQTYLIVIFGLYLGYITGSYNRGEKRDDIFIGKCFTTAFVTHTAQATAYVTISRMNQLVFPFFVTVMLC